MKLFLVLIVSVSLFFTACKEKPASTVKEAVKEVKVEIPKDAKVYTVACGKCIFKEEGTTGCPSWVSIDGKNYPITGEVQDAHKKGLCNHEMKAHLVGEVKDGSFVSTFMHVESDGHDHGHEGHKH
jgi:hypothetical protein